MATAVTMGSVALPEMRKKNYHPGLSCACLAAGGTLGILIPPSMGFIFYAIVTEESIGRLFLAGVLPGMLLAGMFIGSKLVARMSQLVFMKLPYILLFISGLSLLVK